LAKTISTAATAPPIANLVAAAPKVMVRQLSKVYRTRGATQAALAGIDLTVQRGEFLVLLGPSGCGKTTLLRCIAGLEQPDIGEIEIDGNPVFAAERRLYVPPEKRRLSMVFQSYALWPHMRVADNIAYPLRNRGIAPSVVAERVNNVLHLVGLDTLSRNYPDELSGGQQQRVALARAIVGEPGLILFDEPLSNLDARVRDHLRVQLLALQKNLTFTALYVTHDQAEAMALADRVVVMNHGSIAQIGTPTELYHRPSSRFVAEFLGNPNQIEGGVTGIEGPYHRVRTPIGEVLATGDGTTLPTGTAVTILFRPEQCALVAEERPGPNRLAVKLVRAQFLGGYIEQVVEAGAHPLIVHTAPGVMTSEPGSRLWLELSPDQVFAFAGEPAKA
jgi:iron(III) transport system ATP-binding protein